MSVVVKKDFEFDLALRKPLMAHLSTVEGGEPRDSPVWFIWENDCVWLFGTRNDSFVSRLKEEPKCALGIVDFDLDQGILRHVGVRGASEIEPINRERLNRFVAKYLGGDKKKRNVWFIENIVAPLDVMVKITPKTMVVKDVSFFKTGPELAHRESHGS